MRFFLDTEFMEEPNFLQLLSIGIVSEDGHELYLASSEADLDRANPWVQEHVVPHLGSRNLMLPEGDIASAVWGFVQAHSAGQSPSFVGYFADYDWVLFCWLFGRMIDLPAGWPMFCIDLKQEMKRLGVKRDQLPPTGRHHALEDARWIRATWKQLDLDEEWAR